VVVGKGDGGKIAIEDILKSNPQAEILWLGQTATTRDEFVKSLVFMPLAMVTWAIILSADRSGRPGRLLDVQDGSKTLVSYKDVNEATKELRRTTSCSP